ncbi:MAG: glycosyltransferase family 2 protein [Planctomycetales bacterium]|nr:glycosyltransferase family 2 protein [Planctomycetales bacterium]
MLIAAYIILAVVIVLVVCQTAAVSAFVWQLLRFRRDPAAPPPQDAPLPKAAVILSLRGPDPYLHVTLQALQELDYPDYEIHMIVDSESDPVWEDIRRALGTNESNVVTKVLRNPAPTCSLKCSALAQAVRELGDDIEVVAFVDGDAVPHRDWLRDLVAPLSEPGVGVVTGNRWFVPRNVNWGTLVRYFWNVGAVVQVWLNGIVWAGSMAMRRDVIDRIGLLDAWGRALSVDATICRQLRKHNLRVQFAPGVMMANREDIGLKKFVGWVQRQLVAAKSCGPNWRIVALHALSLTGSQLAAFIMLLAALLTGNANAVVVALCAIVAYWSSAAISTLATEFAVRRVLRGNMDQASWPRAAWVAFVPALALTHIAYPYALLGAYSQRRVSWRGVDYVIRGVNDVEMCGYQPYRKQSDVTESVV